MSDQPKCPQHARRTWPAPNGYYQSPAWKALAKACKERDGGCRMANETCKGRLIAHHIVPRSQGGSDTLSNLITICQRHHAYAEAQLKNGHDPWSNL